MLGLRLDEPFAARRRRDEVVDARGARAPRCRRARRAARRGGDAPDAARPPARRRRHGRAARADAGRSPRRRGEQPHVRADARPYDGTNGADRAQARDPAARGRGVRRDRPAGRLEGARRALGPRRVVVDRPAASWPSSRRSGCSRIRTPRRGACRPRAATASTRRSSSTRSRDGRRRSRSTCTEMRNELEEALRRTTETLSRRDPPARARLGAGARGRGRAPRRGAAAPAARRDRRGDHRLAAASRSGSSSSRSRSTPGSSTWARAYLERDGRRARARRERRSGGAFEDPASPLRERRVPRDGAARLRRRRGRAATELYVGGAAGLLGDARGAELEACQRLLEVLERRAAVLGLLSDALDPERTVVRVGPELEGEELRGVVVRRRDLRARRTARSAPSGCSGRCGWTTRRRSARCAPPRSSCRGLVEDVYGARLMATTQRATTTSSSASPRERATPRSSGRSAGSPASSIPTSAGIPRPEPRFRAVAEAYEVLSDPGAPRRPTTGFGHAGLRRGGFSPMGLDFGSLSDVFSAFFGESALRAGGRRGAPGRRGAGRRPRTSEITLAEAFDGHDARASRVRVAADCDACGGNGRRAGARRRSRVPACGGAGRVQQVSQTVFGQIVRTGTCPRCDGAGAIVETPVRALRGRRPDARGRAARARGPGRHPRRPADPRARRGARRRARRARRRRLRARPRPAARGRRARRRRPRVATVDVTMTEAALGPTVSVPTPGRAARGRVAARARSRATSTSSADAGCPRSRPAGAAICSSRVDVRVPTRLTAEQRAELVRLEDELGDDAYRDDDDGFFGRLRSAFR